MPSSLPTKQPHQILLLYKWPETKRKHDVFGMIPHFRTRRGRLNLTSALGFLSHQKKHILEKQIPVRHNEAKKSCFPKSAALSLRWEQNVWSFSEGKSSRGYLASWLGGICTLPNVANSTQERETMTPKLPHIQLHCFSWSVTEEREMISWWFSTVLRKDKLHFMWACVFSKLNILKGPPFSINTNAVKE